MKKLCILTVLGLMAAASRVPATTVAVPVAPGAQALSSAEKLDVTGRCGCPTKPGYGFGTTGHYGPPGQGFTTHNNWRKHAAGDGLTPTGRPLPPVAFTK